MDEARRRSWVSHSYPGRARRGGHTVRFILDKRRTVVVVVLSWKENIPVKQPVDVSGAASPGGGPRWTPARIWRKKLNPVHTLPGRYIDDGFDPVENGSNSNA